MTYFVFWLDLSLIFYAYAGYPLLVRILGTRRASGSQASGCMPPLTVVIAAYNEEARIAARVLDVLAQDYPVDRLTVLVVSDGSSDATARAADVGDPRVRVLELSENRGKAAALNLAFCHIETNLVVFADSRQRFAPRALRKLVGPFVDPDIGAVSGELVIVEDTGSGTHPADIGLYWRMEKALREGEARLGWLHGASGAIYAMRRELIKPLPIGTILDDMYLPLGAVFAGRRVWMARDAIAWDSVSADDADEFRRKLRTLAGNWQLIARLPQLLNPVTNPVFFAWCSHKLLRLIVPWALLAVLVASIHATGLFYRVAFIVQLIAYTGAAFALTFPKYAARIPLSRTAGTFVMLNAAALLSLPACVALDPRGLWKKH